MKRDDLHREMEWAFARTLHAAKELKNGFVPPLGPTSDTAVQAWVRSDAGAMAVVKTLASHAMRLVDGYIDGKETCENCGQMMQRSYPHGLPEGAYILVCRGCGTNMNHVVNPDMAYSANLFSTVSPSEAETLTGRPAVPHVSTE